MNEKYKFVNTHNILRATIFGGSDYYKFVIFNHRVKLNSYKSNKQFTKILNYYKTK